MNEKARHLIVKKAREFFKDARNPKVQGIVSDLYAEFYGYVFGVLELAEYDAELWRLAGKARQKAAEVRSSVLCRHLRKKAA